MRRPSQRTIDDAVLVCLACADGGSLGWPNDAAKNLFVSRARASAAKNLALKAEQYLFSAHVNLSWRARFAHAADLLESGWLPGDPLVLL